MKVECKLKMDLESGEYEIFFDSLDEARKEDIDYYLVKKFIYKCLEDWSNRIENSGIESTDKVIKSIH